MLSFRFHGIAIAALLCALPLFAAETAPSAAPELPPTRALSPQDEAKTFQLPPGYHVELVLSEPEIMEPVITAFDGNGRMYVAEMRSYMQEIDGKNEMNPVSRVSLHWSSKNDGHYDKHTVFADKLVLPRMILPLDDRRVVIGETNTSDLYLYTDTKGVGVADKKELWFQGGPRGGNLEHQPNGLLWSIDNCCYSTYNAYRLRWTPQGVISEPTGNNNGQWGIGQDNHGHIYFVNAGGEAGPQSFQVPVVYGGFNPRTQFEAGFPEVFPLPMHGDVQGGANRFRPADGTLNHVTSSAGIEVYRGDRLPAELRDNLFFGEPVGRLVRRAKITSKDGLITLSNPYQDQKSEFWRSSDQLFRPVNVTTAPDGLLYFTDMYRGIIQEGNWVREGSYLRKVVEQYGYDKWVSRGRIWRLVHDTSKPGPQPAMFSETSVQLVAHLDHPNGWWRDTAQKLLVLKQDKSVVPALTAMARTSPNYLARMHALWTLDGLGATDPALIREKLKDAHPQVRATAIRVSESLFKNGGTSLQPDIQAMSKDKDADVVLQSVLTAKLLNWPSAMETLTQLASASAQQGVREISDLIVHPPSGPVKTDTFSPAEKKLFTAGQDIFNTLCATCHGPDGRGLPMVGGLPGTRLAPSLADSATVRGPKQGPILVLLHGMTGDIAGKKFEGQMIPMATNDDTWIASVLSYARNNFGNHAGFIQPADVAALRASTAARTQPWTYTELHNSLPQPLPNRQTWKATASHNSESAKLALDGNIETRFDTRAGQEPGMWFQVELPTPTEISGLFLDMGKSANDYPRGYKVELSDDGKTWQKPVAAGKGAAGSMTIEFPPVRTKFVRITQTGPKTPGTFWSIHEFQLYAPVKPTAAAANTSVKR